MFDRGICNSMFFIFFLENKARDENKSRDKTDVLSLKVLSKKT